MDTRSFGSSTVDEVQTSRLPAGSTLEINGVHFAHPHAAPNGPGADPRTGDTDAVTETLEGDSRPLDESVRVAPLATGPVEETAVDEKPAV